MGCSLSASVRAGSPTSPPARSQAVGHHLSCRYPRKSSRVSNAERVAAACTWDHDADSGLVDNPTQPTNAIPTGGNDDDK